MINLEQFDILNVGEAKFYNFAQSSDINIKNAFISTFKELYLPLVNEGYFAYETAEMQINPKETVVDCGGNLGLFSAWAAAKGKQVYTFEPSKNINPYLQANLKLYNNIILETKGISDECKMVDFTDCYFSCGSHLSEFNINHSCLPKETYQIETISLNEYFIDTKVDFIKMDIEGSELKAILGADILIKRDTPKLAIACYHQQNYNQQIKELIKSYNSNYQFFQKDGILFAWIP